MGCLYGIVWVVFVLSEVCVMGVVVMEGVEGVVLVWVVVLIVIGGLL